jgi:hypothetical protein
VLAFLLLDAPAVFNDATPDDVVNVETCPSLPIVVITTVRKLVIVEGPAAGAVVRTEVVVSTAAGVVEEELEGSVADELEEGKEKLVGVVVVVSVVVVVVELEDELALTGSQVVLGSPKEVLSCSTTVVENEVNVEADPCTHTNKSQLARKTRAAQGSGCAMRRSPEKLSQPGRTTSRSYRQQKRSHCH